MRKAAAIDIGTNSMRLLLCELCGNTIVSKQKFINVTRIGQGVSATQRLSVDAVDRNIAALKEFVQKAQAFGAEEIKIIATSAVRDAQNKQEFVDKAREATGLEVEAITGQREAELGIIGALEGLAAEDKMKLVIDIGGGSTELILQQDGRIIHMRSIDAGAVRMTESCIQNDPPTKEDLKSLERAVEQKFFEQLKLISTYNVDEIIAIGGTATTVAAIFHKLGIYKAEIIHNTTISKDFIGLCFEELTSKALLERQQIVGLQKERADIIAAGVYILKHIVQTLNKQSIKVSDSDNLEGILLSMMKHPGLDE